MDISLFLRAVASLAFVLGLIGAAAWAFRRFNWKVRTTPSKADNRRLAVREVLALDARHRLVLVQHDDKEHLLLIGLDGSRVVESGVSTGGSAPPRETVRS